MGNLEALPCNREGNTACEQCPFANPEQSGLDKASRDHLRKLVDEHGMPKIGRVLSMMRQEGDPPKFIDMVVATVEEGFDSDGIYDREHLLADATLSLIRCVQYQKNEE